MPHIRDILLLLLLFQITAEAVNGLTSTFRRSHSVKMNTYREEHKVLLVVFSDTVVHPGTVMIHLFDAAFAHTAGGRAHIHTDIITMMRLEANALMYSESQTEAYALLTDGEESYNNRGLMHRVKNIIITGRRAKRGGRGCRQGRPPG